MYPITRTLLTFWVSLLLFGTAHSANLKVHDVQLYRDFGDAYAVVHLSWDYAWRNARNYDAVWLFLKLLREDGQGYVHLYLTPNGHELTFAPHADLNIEVPEGGTGLFLFPAVNYRGEVSATLRIAIDEETLGDININRGLLYARTCLQ